MTWIKRKWVDFICWFCKPATQRVFQRIVGIQCELKIHETRIHELEQDFQKNNRITSLSIQSLNTYAKEEFKIIADHFQNIPVLKPGFIVLSSYHIDGDQWIRLDGREIQTNRYPNLPTNLFLGWAQVDQFMPNNVLNSHQCVKFPNIEERFSDWPSKVFVYMYGGPM
jgi:hypothetical protein